MALFVRFHFYRRLWVVLTHLRGTRLERKLHSKRAPKPPKRRRSIGELREVNVKTWRKSLERGDENESWVAEPESFSATSGHKAPRKLLRRENVFYFVSAMRPVDDMFAARRHTNPCFHSRGSNWTTKRCQTIHRIRQKLACTVSSRFKPLASFRHRDSNAHVWAFPWRRRCGKTKWSNYCVPCVIAQGWATSMPRLFRRRKTAFNFQVRARRAAQCNVYN